MIQAHKIQIRTAQLVHKLAMKFQQLYLCFRGPVMNIGNVVRPNGKKPEMGNPKWQPLNSKYAYISVY